MRSSLLALSSLIFRELTSNLVELGAVAELLQRFFFPGVFLALDIVSKGLEFTIFVFNYSFPIGILKTNPDRTQVYRRKRKIHIQEYGAR
jgi:hypothetical protein